MLFSQIPGHEEVKRRLRAMAASDRIPHAILLDGPAGIGKYALARAFVQYVHCAHRDPNGDACGECPNCRQHAAMQHIDTPLVFPIVKPERWTSPNAPVADDFVDEFRSYLADRPPFMDIDAWTASFDRKNAVPVTYVTQSDDLSQRLSFTSNVTRYKAVVWWLPERMNEQASDKLLKLLEEPPQDSLFVMASDNSRLIIPTILSRLQRIEVSRYSDNEIVDWLEANMEVDRDAALTAARAADGSMTRAINALADSAGADSMLDRFIQLMRLAWQRDIAALRQWGTDLAGLGRERQVAFYNYASSLLRENFVYGLKLRELTRMTGAEEGFSSRFAQFITAANVEELHATFAAAADDTAANGNAKIINLDVAIRVIFLLKQ